MKHLLPTLLTALLCSGLFAQTFTLNNYMAGGSAGGDGITDIITDAAGNTYVTGYFSGTVDFDPGTAVYNLTTSLPHEACWCALAARSNTKRANKKSKKLNTPIRAGAGKKEFWMMLLWLSNKVLEPRERIRAGAGGFAWERGQILIVQIILLNQILKT